MLSLVILRPARFARQHHQLHAVQCFTRSTPLSVLYLPANSHASTLPSCTACPARAFSLCRQGHACGQDSYRSASGHPFKGQQRDGIHRGACPRDRAILRGPGSLAISLHAVTDQVRDTVRPLGGCTIVPQTVLNEDCLDFGGIFCKRRICALACPTFFQNADTHRVGALNFTFLLLHVCTSNRRFLCVACLLLMAARLFRSARLHS